MLALEYFVVFPFWRHAETRSAHQVERWFGSPKKEGYYWILVQENKPVLLTRQHMERSIPLLFLHRADNSVAATLILRISIVREGEKV